AVKLRLVGVMQHVHYVRAADAGGIVQPRLIETARLQVFYPSGGMLLHVLLGAEHERAGGTGLDAGGLAPNGDAIRAQRALVGLMIALRDSRDVEWATGNAVAAPDAVLLVKVHDAVRVLHDRAGCRAGFQAARVGAVHAAVLADQPLQVARRILVFRETHERPGMLGQVSRIVVNADVAADFVAQVVPFHAGNLAGFAADAFRRVDELRDRAGRRLPYPGRWRGGRGAADDVE